MSGKRLGPSNFLEGKKPEGASVLRKGGLVVNSGGKKHQGTLM